MLSIRSKVQHNDDFDDFDNFDIWKKNLLYFRGCRLTVLFITKTSFFSDERRQHTHGGEWRTVGNRIWPRWRLDEGATDKTIYHRPYARGFCPHFLYWNNRTFRRSTSSLKKKKKSEKIWKIRRWIKKKPSCSIELPSCALHCNEIIYYMITTIQSFVSSRHDSWWRHQKN